MHNSRYRIAKISCGGNSPRSIPQTPPLRLGALDARSALHDFILPPIHFFGPPKPKILPTGLFKCNDFHIETKQFFTVPAPLDVLDPTNFNILVAPLYITSVVGDHGQNDLDQIKITSFVILI